MGIGPVKNRLSKADQDAQTGIIIHTNSLIPGSPIYITIMDSNPNKPGLIHGSAIFLAASLIIYLIRFIIGVVVARALGADGKGVYSLVLITASMLLVLFNIGTGSALTYFTASQKNTPRRLVAFAFGAGAVLGVAGGAVFYILYLVFLSNNLLAGIDQRYILWVTLTLPLNLMAVFLSGILIGLQRFLVYNALELTRASLMLIFIVISVIMNASVSGAILSWLLAYVIHFFLISTYILKSIGFQWQISRKEAQPMISYGAKSYAGNLMTLFTYRLDNYLVNFYSGVASVGIYTTSVSTAEILWNLPNAVSSALFPKISGLDETTGSLLTARTCRILVLVSIPLAILFGVVGYILIPVIFGEQFTASAVPFLLLLPGMIFVLVTKILSANLSGRGKPQYPAYTAAATLALTILLDIYLIPRMGVPGAALASTVSYLVGAILALTWFHKISGLSWQTALIVERGDIPLLKQQLGEAYRSVRHLWMRP
jgi:O-antigen/teichoic acid export membrane protein